VTGDKKNITAKDILIKRDEERLAVIEAEVQKKLTKAAGYFSGLLVRSLGLRYAPEIRFQRDNSIQIYRNYERQVNQLLEEQKREKANAEDPLGMMAQMKKPLL